MTHNVRPDTDPAPPRQRRPSAGLPESSTHGAEEFAQDLKRAEANHTSFEHHLPHHRLLAADLIADGYIKLPTTTDEVAVQELAERSGLPPAAVRAVIEALTTTDTDGCAK